MAGSDSTDPLNLYGVYEAAVARSDALRAEIEEIQDEIYTTQEMARDIRRRMRQAVDLQARRCRLEQRLTEHVTELNRLRAELAAAQEAKPMAFTELPRLRIKPHEIAAAERSIVQASVDCRAQDTCGVYFLIRDDKIVYVGQSLDVAARVVSHRRDANKRFNRAAWVECEPDRLDEVERFWIRALRPEHNRAGLQDVFAAETEMATLAAVADALAT